MTIDRVESNWIRVGPERNKSVKTFNCQIADSMSSGDYSQAKTEMPSSSDREAPNNTHSIDPPPPVDGIPRQDHVDLPELPEHPYVPLSFSSRHSESSVSTANCVLE